MADAGVLGVFDHSLDSSADRVKTVEFVLQLLADLESGLVSGFEFECTILGTDVELKAAGWSCNRKCEVRLAAGMRVLLE